MAPVPAGTVCGAQVAPPSAVASIDPTAWDGSVVSDAVAQQCRLSVHASDVATDAAGGSGPPGDPRTGGAAGRERRHVAGDGAERGAAAARPAGHRGHVGGARRHRLRRPGGSPVGGGEDDPRADAGPAGLPDRRARPRRAAGDVGEVADAGRQGLDLPGRPAVDAGHDHRARGRGRRGDARTRPPSSAGRWRTRPPAATGRGRAGRTRRACPARGRRAWRTWTRTTRDGGRRTWASRRRPRCRGRRRRRPGRRAAPGSGSRLV